MVAHKVVVVMDVRSYTSISLSWFSIYYYCLWVPLVVYVIGFVLNVDFTIFHSLSEKLQYYYLNSFFSQ